jgi:hypothetical protein
MASSAPPVESQTSVVTVNDGCDQPAPHRIVYFGDGHRGGSFVGRSFVRCVMQKEAWTLIPESPVLRSEMLDQVRRAPPETFGVHLPVWFLAARAGRDRRAPLAELNVPAVKRFRVQECRMRASVCDGVSMCL